MKSDAVVDVEIESKFRKELVVVADDAKHARKRFENRSRRFEAPSNRSVVPLSIRLARTESKFRLGPISREGNVTVADDTEPARERFENLFRPFEGRCSQLEIPMISK